MAVADALICVVLEQLASYVQQEVKLVVNVREEVGKLATTLKLLQAVLDDAEEKQVKNKSIKIWLEELKEIMYIADDLMDEWQTRVSISQFHQHFGFKVLSCFCLKHVIEHYDISQRIKEIRESIDVIALKKDQYSLSIGQIQDDFQRLTSSVLDASVIRGRERDQKILLNWVLENTHEEQVNVQVISVVGMGGFGKTTLAKLVFTEERVLRVFEKMMWVCVSEPFNLVGIAKAIIEEADGYVPSVIGWEALHQCLCKCLKGKRFLLVLDNVWTRDPDQWEQLKLALNGGAQGSRVIVTTRDEEVAKMMGSTQRHYLGKLSDEDCWLLFEHLAFQGRQEDSEKFEEIGRGIAKKCKGVPLAAKILASLMRHKKTKKEWNSVLASDIWDLQQIEKGFLPSFFMSYYPLSSNLKQCFMYCAIFPKDTKIVKDELIQLWMSQSFLGSGGNKDLERTGSYYFDDLVMRSFFQDVEKDSEGNITSCKMHDLVHDFAQFLTKNECYILEKDKEMESSSVRHLVSENMKNSSIYKAKNLRTLLTNTPTIPVELFNQLTCLRALDLSYSDIEELPSEVKRLLHLRYLDLSWTQLSELPETITYLLNLQTLKLNWCENLIKLPDGIGKLSNLRHLGILGTDALSYLPKDVGRLRFLRTLNKFIVGAGCNIGYLKQLNFLRGDLEINGLERVADFSEASQAELKKKKLNVLTLNFEHLEDEDGGRMNDVLEKLEPHGSLEELNMYGFSGSKFPSWIPSNSMSANLLRLLVLYCPQCIKLPALGKLASLEKLEIGGMRLVKHIGHEFYGFDDAGSSSGANKVVAFPKLKILKVCDMRAWKDWELRFSASRKIMPCLSELSLLNCPKLGILPGLGGLPSLESLVIKEMHLVKRVGIEFFGISDDTDNGCEEGVDSREAKKEVIFSKLTNLELHDMEEWEDSELPLHWKDGEISIMPCLHKLYISSLTKLKLIPHYMLPLSLRKLYISKCPKLSGMQPVLPPFLEDLKFWYDLGSFSKSLPISEESLYNKHSTLRSVSISFSPYPSLPKGLNQLMAVQVLKFYKCEFLDFELKDLMNLKMLDQLTIERCPLLKERFREGEDWRSILFQVSVIAVDYKEITRSN